LVEQKSHRVAGRGKIWSSTKAANANACRISSSSSSGYARFSSCVIPAKPSNPKCKDLSCLATDIRKVDASSGKEERIQHFDQDAEFSSYSRDGRTVAFMSAKAVHPNVWVASLEGGGPRQVTFDPESMGFPSWSPDGKTLALEAKRGDPDSIYLLEPGKTPEQLHTRLRSQLAL
jgi:dipeptidyl aminopeptidase/acylaminoacyl peptidase